VDKDTIKQLCVNCGGKGFYLLMQGFPNSKAIGKKGEIMSCDCEAGFNYKQRVEQNHGRC